MTTKKELLEDVRSKQKALEGAGATATLRRLEYTRAVRAVHEHRAFEDEGFADYYAWAREALGLQRAQAAVYLAAALCPVELVQGRDFDLTALALLGRVNDRPELQAELAAGIQRHGLPVVERAWARVRNRLCGTAEAKDRVLLLLRSAMESGASNAQRRGATQRAGRLKSAVRVIMGAVTRQATGDEMTAEEERLLTSLRSHLQASPPGPGAAPPESGFSDCAEKPNDSRQEAEKLLTEKVQTTSPPLDRGAAALADADLDDEPAQEVLQLSPSAVLAAGMAALTAARDGEGRARVPGALTCLIKGGAPDGGEQGRQAAPAPFRHSRRG